MDVIYKIHNNFEHCGVTFKDEFISYYKLKEILKVRTSTYKKKNKLKKVSESTKVDEYYKSYEKSNLTEEQLKQFFLDDKKKGANAWKTSLRSKRRRGKLDSEKVQTLNKLGMLWNPTKDEWEKNFIKFKGNFMREVLDAMKYCHGLGRSKISSLIKLNAWINEQRNLFQSNNLKEENLLRLKSIKFPFEIDNQLEEKFSLNRLIVLIAIIEDLNSGYRGSSGNKDFTTRYKLEGVKNYIGSSVEINESVVFSIEEQEMIQNQKINKEYSKQWEKDWRIIEELGKKDALEKLKEVNAPSHFIKLIDKTYNNRKGFDEKYIELNFIFTNKYNHNFKTSEGFYTSVIVDYNYNDDIKLYALEKAISIIEKELKRDNMIKSNWGIKCFKNIIKTLVEQNNKNEILNIKRFVDEHQFMKLKFGENLN